MVDLKREDLILVKGGAALTSSAINAVMKAVSTMFGIGQAVGSAIRRIRTGKYC